jgi:hypothetical protein
MESPRNIEAVSRQITARRKLDRKRAGPTGF